MDDRVSVRMVVARIDEILARIDEMANQAETARGQREDDGAPTDNSNSDQGDSN